MASDDHASETDSEGPWLPAQRRRLTAAEMRLYRRKAHLEPEAAAEWADAFLGPYETGRAVAAGKSVSEALEARARSTKHSGLNWPGFSKLAAAHWSWLGVDEAQATDWAALGLSPNQAGSWISAGFKTASAAGEWLAVGFDPVASAAWRCEGFLPAQVHEWAPSRGTATGGRSSGMEDQSRVLDPIGFTPAQASEWRAGGFSGTEAKAWGATGLGPDQSAAAKQAGQKPDEVIAQLVESSGDRVVVWGLWYDDQVQVGLLEDIEWLALSGEHLEAILGCIEWSDLVDRLGASEVEDEFEELLNEAWDAEHEEAGLEDWPARPKGWVPRGPMPEMGLDWLSDRPRIDDPDNLNLPESIMDLGRYSASPVSGDFVSWDMGSLHEIARLTIGEGFAFVRRQDLIGVR